MLKVLHIIILTGLFSGFTAMENENSISSSEEFNSESETIVRDLPLQKTKRQSNSMSSRSKFFKIKRHATQTEMETQYTTLITEFTPIFFLNANDAHYEELACPEEYLIRFIDFLFKEIKQVDPNQEETIIRLINGFVDNKWSKIFEMITNIENKHQGYQPLKYVIQKLLYYKDAWKARRARFRKKEYEVGKASQGTSELVYRRQMKAFQEKYSNFFILRMEKYLTPEVLEEKKQEIINQLKIVAHILFHIKNNLSNNGSNHSIEDIIEGIYRNPACVFTSDILKNNIKDPNFIQLILLYQNYSSIFINDGVTNMSQVGPGLLESINNDIKSGLHEDAILNQNPMVAIENLLDEPEGELIGPADNNTLRDLQKKYESIIKDTTEKILNGSDPMVKNLKFPEESLMEFIRISLNNFDNHEVEAIKRCVELHTTKDFLSLLNSIDLIKNPETIDEFNKSNRRLLSRNPRKNLNLIKKINNKIIEQKRMKNLIKACEIISYIKKNSNSRQKIQNIIKNINGNPSIVFKNLTIKKTTLSQPIKSSNIMEYINPMMGSISTNFNINPMDREFQQLPLDQNPIQLQQLTSLNGNFNIAKAGKEFFPNQTIEYYQQPMEYYPQPMGYYPQPMGMFQQNSYNSSLYQIQHQNHLTSNYQPGSMNAGFNTNQPFPPQIMGYYQQQPMAMFQKNPYNSSLYPNQHQAHLTSHYQPGSMNAGFNTNQPLQNFIEIQAINYLQQQPKTIFPLNQSLSYPHQNPMATTMQGNLSGVKPIITNQNINLNPNITPSKIPSAFKPNTTTPSTIGSSTSAFKPVKGNSSKISENSNQTVTNIANHYINQFGNQPKSN
jgi:hypothetical protein